MKREERYALNHKLLSEGKGFNELECIFTLEEVEEAIKEMYPDMNQKEINYHSQHIIDNTNLKVCSDEDELDKAIEEQVEDLNV